MHIAIFNIGKLKYDLGDACLEDYIAAAEVVSKIAERCQGFVWKTEVEERGGGTSRLIDGDPRIVVQLSVWEDAESLKHFLWNTLHKKIYQRRDEWFCPLDRKTMVLWNVAEDERPELNDAVERLDALRAYGATDYAYDWAFLKSSICG